LIREWTFRLLRDPATYRQMARKVDVYGDGRASERIADGVGLASRDSEATEVGTSDLNRHPHDARRLLPEGAIVAARSRD